MYDTCILIVNVSTRAVAAPSWEGLTPPLPRCSCKFLLYVKEEAVIQCLCWGLSPCWSSPVFPELSCCVLGPPWTRFLLKLHNYNIKIHIFCFCHSPPCTWWVTLMLGHPVLGFYQNFDYPICCLLFLFLTPFAPFCATCPMSLHLKDRDIGLAAQNLSPPETLHETPLSGFTMYVCFVFY